MVETVVPNIDFNFTDFGKNSNYKDISSMNFNIKQQNKDQKELSKSKNTG